MDLRFPAPSSDDAIPALSLATETVVPPSKAAGVPTGAQANALSAPASCAGEGPTMTSVAPVYQPPVVAVEAQRNSTSLDGARQNGTGTEADGAALATASGASTVSAHPPVEPNATAAVP